MQVRVALYFATRYLRTYAPRSLDIVIRLGCDRGIGRSRLAAGKEVVRFSKHSKPARSYTPRMQWEVGR